MTFWPRYVFWDPALRRPAKSWGEPVKSQTLQIKWFIGLKS